MPANLFEIFVGEAYIILSAMTSLSERLKLFFLYEYLLFVFQFFATQPYACEPSSLPKYPPSKEMDAKLRDEEARRCVYQSRCSYAHIHTFPLIFGKCFVSSPCYCKYGITGQIKLYISSYIFLYMNLCKPPRLIFYHRIFNLLLPTLCEHLTFFMTL